MQDMCLQCQPTDLGRTNLVLSSLVSLLTGAYIGNSGRGVVELAGTWLMAEL